jgi:hypothetical protein
VSPEGEDLEERLSGRVGLRVALATGGTICVTMLSAAVAWGWSNGGGAPGISLLKLERDGGSAGFTRGPITGTVGDTIEYQMTMVNTGNTPLAIALSDTQCDPGTLSAPTVLSGSFDAAAQTLSPGGQLQYTCSHVLAPSNAPQFTNTATATGRPPAGSPVSATSSVVTQVNVPAISVAKLQREGASGPFTASPIDAIVGKRIQYEIQVSNTGNTPLALSLSDPLCDAGTLEGPTSLSGTLSVNVLSPGGQAQYTCSHVLTGADASPFTNTATVTGAPPSGPPVVGTSSVTANKQAVAVVTIARCARGKVKRTRKIHGKKVTACVARKPAVISRKPVRHSGFTG